MDEEGGVLCGVSFVHLPAWREDNTIVSQSVSASPDQEDNEVKKLDHGSYMYVQYLHYSRLTKLHHCPSYGEFPPPPTPPPILSFTS